jgi:hypothetical protein
VVSKISTISRSSSIQSSPLSKLLDIGWCRKSTCT